MRSFLRNSVALLVVVIWLGLTTTETRAQGELRLYAGTLSAVENTGESGEQPIRIVAYVPQDGQARELYWVQTETEGRRVAWPDRFGRITWDAQGQTTGSHPRILFEWGAGESLVPVLLVSGWREDLSGGAQWELDGLSYQANGPVPIVNQPDQMRWEISVRDELGEKRFMTTDASRPLIRGLQETVFLGQGLEHRLRLELQETRAVPEAAWQQALADYARLEALRQQLGGPSDAPQRRWTDEQLALLKTTLPQLEAEITSEGFQSLIRQALVESKEEHSRVGALDSLRQKALTRTLSEVELEAVTGEPLGRTDLAGKVAVIHFWDYREEPLREPYGQVGYLDFLFRKYEEQGLRVLGVVVNQRAAIPEQRKGAMTSARKFASFMNLAYPIYADDGMLLDHIGDPRQSANSLPLFVVVGRDGRIIHYSAGYYEVKANEGLAELESVIKQALRMGE